MPVRLRVYGAIGMLAAALGASIACGQWAPPAPTTPSPFLSTPSHGATLSGSVVNAIAGVNPLLASSTSDAATASLTVNVVGTEITAPVSVSGRFVLEGVPSGSVFLRFTGPGVDATLRVDGINDREIVDIKLMLEVSTARVESTVRIKIDNTTEIEGEVTRVTGTCPNLTVVVHGWTINLNASTAGSCADVRVGIRIKIKGHRQGSVIVVVKVESDDDDPDDDDDDDDGGDDDDDD